MLVTGVGGVKAETTYKLEIVTEVEAGGLYVFEQSGYVMTTVSSKVLQITKTYKTTGLKGSEDYVFTLESATASDKETQGFKMKNMSLSSYQYIGNKSSSTDMTATSVDAAAVWAFNFQDDQTVLIQNLNNNNRFLGFNNATTPTGYKAYAASNMSANPHAIVVYKLVEESSLSSAGLAFAENSYTATLGETFTAPQLTNPNNLPVTYASSDANVATVAADGSVTLIGAGTTTITASSEATAEYAAGSASYTLTVSKAPLVVNPKNVNSNYFVKVTDVAELEDGDAILIVNEGAERAMSTTQNKNNRGECEVKISNFVIETTENDGTQHLILVEEDGKFYFNTGDREYLYAVSSSDNYLRTGNDCDNNYKAAISIKDGNASIIFQGSNTRNTLRYNSTNKLFSCYASGQQDVQIYKEVVKPVVAVEAPTFSVEEGTYYGPQTVELACVTEDATIKYSTDGETWSDYTSAIDISETTTLYAKAVKGEDESAVVSATYTIPTTYATIAAFKEANTSACLNLTGAQVVYVDANNKNIYVRDASSAICLYNNDGFTFEDNKELKAGDILSGIIYGKYSLYNNLPEITDIQNFDKLTVTDNTDVTPKAVASKEEIAANMCDLVKITKAQISETDSKYYVLGVQLYDKLKLGYEPVTGVNANITGVVTDYKSETEIFPRTAGDIVYYPAAPTFSPEAGTFTAAQDVTISTTTDGAEIYYTTDGSEPTTSSSKYSAAIPVNSSTTIKAIAVKNELSSEVTEATYMIEIPEPVVEPGTPAAITAGFYTIKNLGNEKFVNVAGRKTVTFVDETATAPGTVIKVESNEKGQVQVLRSQGVDIPGYAQKAMNYVPEIVQLVAQKLGAEGEGNLLGKDGLDALLKKFDESFDYHLYTEQAERGVRIYGKTPSMEPVVEFYQENKANVDEKLPMLEDFINSAIDKILQKTNGSGASILEDFSLLKVWEKMGGTLTKPETDATKLEFLQQVLANKENVWNFAYQTAMIYWTNLKNHKKFAEYKDKLGEYAKYIDKIEYIRPDVKYYIVANGTDLDFYSQDNALITGNDASTMWTLTKRTDFKVTFNEENLLNGKYYTTFYADFAYTLPTDGSVKAYKVTEVNENTGVAKKVVLESVPAQTPVLLEATSADAQTLTLNTEDGTAPTDNILRGPDYLINDLGIKTAQVEMLFNLAKELLGEDSEFYKNNIAKYEHLMARNAGTVNNKYFFGLDQTDMKNAQNVRMLNLNDAGENLGFYSNWTSLEANRAFIVDAHNPVKLYLKGDVNRDGMVTIADVTALVNIILGKATLENNPNNYDFDAAYVNNDDVITIADVTALVNIILGKN